MQRSIPDAKLLARSDVMERGMEAYSVAKIPSYIFCVCCNGIDMNDEYDAS